MMPTQESYAQMVRDLTRLRAAVPGVLESDAAEYQCSAVMTEAEVRDALSRLDPLWDELFPAEQERIVRLLVDRVDVRAEGAAVRLRLDGLGSLVRDLAAQPSKIGREAA